jgi:hypothetical protein
MPQKDDVLRLTLRRRVPLPEAVDSKPQCVTIAGEARCLSPASINVLRWLFDHDPTTVRALYAGLAPHDGQDPIEAALRELLRSGFLVVSPGD